MRGKALAFWAKRCRKNKFTMILAGLETLSNGRILLDGTDITGLDEDWLAALRRDLVGIVFQAFRLIPSLTALQNVTIPLELAGRDDAHDMAKAALQSVHLAHRLSHLPDQMSGGEQQRVAMPELWLLSHEFAPFQSQPATSIVSLRTSHQKLI